MRGLPHVRLYHVITNKGIIVNLNTIINNPESPDGLKRDAITLLTSLSKGTNNNIVALCDYGAYRTLIDVLINSQSPVLLLATLRKSI